MGVNQQWGYRQRQFYLFNNNWWSAFQWQLFENFEISQRYYTAIRNPLPACNL